MNTSTETPVKGIVPDRVDFNFDNPEDLLAELGREKQEKWDKRVLARDLWFQGNGNFRMRDGALHHMALTKGAHHDIANRYGIHWQYYTKMLEAERFDLLARNLNTWRPEDDNDDLVFVRGRGPHQRDVRAVLSQRYRVLDHMEAVTTVMQEVARHHTSGLQFDVGYLGERKLEATITCLNLEGLVRPGDKVIGGFKLGNSETGDGSTWIVPRIKRLICSNGLTVEALGNARVVHHGKDDDEEVFARLRRAVRETFEHFPQIVEALTQTTYRRVRVEPQRVIRNVVRDFELSEKQQERLLLAFGGEPEDTQFGIVQAITSAAQNEETRERRFEMEAIGGKVMQMSSSAFERLEREEPKEKDKPSRSRRRS